MAPRANDPAGIKIDRTIQLWQILTVLAFIAGQAILLWQSQREQAIEMKHTTAAIADMAAAQKAMAIQINIKDSTDNKQDSQLSDHERRLLKLESGK